MRYSGIGGQAVIEGVMMRNADKYAVSVRTPEGTIETKVNRHKSLKDKYAFFGFPVIRGVVSFVESLVMGVQTLNYSAGIWEEEEEEHEKKEKADGKKADEKKDKTEGLWMGLVVMLAVILAISLFVLLPFFVSELLSKVIRSVQLRGLIEGVIRVLLFVSYVKAISYMEDIRRVFMYHGAEHKCINCLENGHELTVENAKRQTMVHKRCGTSFMLVVMFISILFFMFISVENMWLRMVLRILLIPLIAGLSYEFIMFAGKSGSPVVAVLSMPGLWLQSLTTKEPDTDMLEVAIASVEAVFDWKQFLKSGAAAAPEPEAAATEERKAKKPAAAATEERKAKKTAAAAQKKVQKPVQKPVEKPAAAAKEPMKEAAQPTSDFEVLEMDDEEDDEILKALDRYFDDTEKPAADRNKQQ